MADLPASFDLHSNQGLHAPIRLTESLHEEFMSQPVTTPAGTYGAVTGGNGRSTQGGELST